VMQDDERFRKMAALRQGRPTTVMARCSWKR
jgi:hypothetical protein